MKAKAATARARKKMAGTDSTRAAVKKISAKTGSKQNTRKSIRDEIQPELKGPDRMQTAKSRQSQTHPRKKGTLLTVKNAKAGNKPKTAGKKTAARPAKTGMKKSATTRGSATAR